jgi:hypothetical protein
LAAIGRRKEMGLPEGVVFVAQGKDIIIVGSEMTADLYRSILNKMPEAMKPSVLGWKRVGVLPTNGGRNAYCI